MVHWFLPGWTSFAFATKLVFFPFECSRPPRDKLLARAARAAEECKTKWAFCETGADSHRSFRVESFRRAEKLLEHEPTIFPPNPHAYLSSSFKPKQTQEEEDDGLGQRPASVAGFEILPSFSRRRAQTVSPSAPTARDSRHFFPTHRRQSHRVPGRPCSLRPLTRLTRRCRPRCSPEPSHSCHSLKSLAKTISFPSFAGLLPPFRPLFPSQINSQQR